MAEATVEQKSGNNTVLIIGIVAVILIIACGVGGYFLGVKQGASATPPPAASSAAKETAMAAESNTIGSLLPLDEIIVNLLDDQETRYLKAAITLELDSQDTADEITMRLPQVRDAAILLMSSKTLLELHDLQGKLQLRAELIEKINGFLKTGAVKNIYFTDFIVQ